MNGYFGDCSAGDFETCLEVAPMRVGCCGGTRIERRPFVMPGFRLTRRMFERIAALGTRLPIVVVAQMVKLSPYPHLVVSRSHDGTTKGRKERRCVTASTICSPNGCTAWACGVRGPNDAARLAGDPIHKLLLGRDAITSAALASQPTLSRFENGVTRGKLLRMSQALFDTVLRRQGKRLRGKVRTITIDLASPCNDEVPPGCVHLAAIVTLFAAFR